MTKCSKRKITLFKLMGVNLVRLFTITFLKDIFKDGILRGVKMWFASLLAFVVIAVADIYNMIFEPGFPHCTRMTVTDEKTTFYPEDD